MATGKKISPRTKHIALKYHHFISHVKYGRVDIHYRTSGEKLDNNLTKPLSNKAFLTLITYSMDGVTPNNQSQIWWIFCCEECENTQQETNVIELPMIRRVFADASQAYHSCKSTRKSYEPFLIMGTLTKTPFVAHKTSLSFWKAHVDILSHLSPSIATELTYSIHFMFKPNP